MAQKVTVAHHPELTPQTAMEIFQKHFGNRYRVRKIHRTIARDFIICKSSLTGIRVKLEQREGSTSFIFDGEAPNALLAILFWLCLGIAIAIIVYLTVLKPRLQEMEDEVRQYLEQAPEFH